MPLQTRGCRRVGAPDESVLGKVQDRLVPDEQTTTPATTWGPVGCWGGDTRTGYLGAKDTRRSRVQEPTKREENLTNGKMLNIR